MEVILLEDVKSVGKKGDKVTVSDGYARNVLFRKNLALEATKKNINDLKLKKANEDRKEAARVAEAQALADSLKDKSVVVSIKCGEGGRTFGSVSTKEIAGAVTSQLGYDIDKKKMVLNDSIRALGVYRIPVKLYKNVTGELVVKVEEQK